MKHRLIILVLMLAACTDFQRTENPADPVVARAYGVELSLSEVTRIMPRNISPEDSTTLSQNYINKWLQQQILLHYAKENLLPEEQDFTRQMEEYRNSLLLYTYEKKLISMNLDTVVNEAEIEEYYRQNKEQFELKGNIVKFDFVKLPKNSKQLKDFRRMLKPGNISDSLTLLDYCHKYSTDYWLAKEWVFFQDLMEVMPIELDNEEHFLRRTNFTEKQVDDYYYLLRINDFKTTDSIPPLAFEKDNIRNIIMNSRKLDVVERLRQKDIDEAFRNREVEILNNTNKQ